MVEIPFYVKVFIKHHHHLARLAPGGDGLAMSDVVYTLLVARNDPHIAFNIRSLCQGLFRMIRLLNRAKRIGRTQTYNKSLRETTL